MGGRARGCRLRDGGSVLVSGRVLGCCRDAGRPGGARERRGLRAGAGGSGAGGPRRMVHGLPDAPPLRREVPGDPDRRTADRRRSVGPRGGLGHRSRHAHHQRGGSGLSGRWPFPRCHPRRGGAALRASRGIRRNPGPGSAARTPAADHAARRRRAGDRAASGRHRRRPGTDCRPGPGSVPRTRRAESARSAQPPCRG